MKLDLSRHAPPGIHLRLEVSQYLAGCGSAVLFSMQFLVRYFGKLDSLYMYMAGERILEPGRIMPDFIELLGFSLIGFAILALCCLGFVVYHYLYHRIGSKSIYLMRRLPNRYELHRRCWTLPLLALALTTLLCFLFLLLYFLLYMKVTPDECLLPNQWQKIWSVIS